MRELSLLSSRLRKAFFAALLVPVVFLGALELHPAGEAHGFLAGTHEEIFSCVQAATSHPTHVHAAMARELPPCPACLLRMQTRGTHSLAKVAPLTLPDLENRLQAAANPSLERYLHSLCDARGPPLS